jgi:hypothetical protein
VVCDITGAVPVPHQRMVLEEVSLFVVYGADDPEQPTGFFSGRGSAALETADGMLCV